MTDRIVKFSNDGFFTSQMGPKGSLEEMLIAPKWVKGRRSNENYVVKVFNYEGDKDKELETKVTLSMDNLIELAGWIAAQVSLKAAEDYAQAGGGMTSYQNRDKGDEND